LKKVFLSISVIVIGIFLSLGCVTKQVWTENHKAFPYNETIISFYSNTEKKEIIFIGKKYHYIFNKHTKNFIALLKQKELLKLIDRKLSVDANLYPRDNGEVSAHIEFEFKKSKINKAQKEWLIKYAQDNGEIYRVFFNIKGTRYYAKSEVNSQVLKLQKPIPLSINEYKIEKKSTLYKVAMTPLSVTADAVLVVVGVGAAIIYSPFILGHWVIESVTK
jgi:hypothetical protein